MLKFPDEVLENYRSNQFGWSTALSPLSKYFPEIIGRSMVWQRDFYVRGDRERLVIDWDRDNTILALARNGEWQESLTVERLMMLTRELVIDGQTAKEFLTGLFEFELCAECAGDGKDHTAAPDQFGKWHAWCRFDAPRMMQFVITSAPANRQHPLQRLTYGTATEIQDEALRVAACDLLAEYRKEQHNK